MSTSRAVLQSFLRDALKENKQLVDLSFEDLLEYNRTECGLIKIAPEQVNFENESVDFATLKQLLHGNTAIVFQTEGLYYVDIKNASIRLLKEPGDSAQSIDSSDYSRYHYLKQSCSKTYKRARGKELDCIKYLIGRPFTEHRSDDFLPSLEFYLGILDNTERVMFAYMNGKQKRELVHNLKVTLLLLAAQQRHEIDYQKTENAKKYDVYIKKCSKLLIELDPEYQERIKMHPEQEEFHPAQPIKYLGIPIGQLLARDLVDLSGGAAKKIRDNMGSLNEGRLYWAWGSSFLKTVIGLIPEDRYYQKQAADVISMPDPYTGNLSWILYYARFSLNLFLLLKHTINHPWMSDEEAKTPWHERFLTQWSQRKFTLLNDSIWGAANLVCFFWLTGTGVLGMAGDAITLALLVFDIAIAIWDFAEQNTKYNKAMQEYQDDLEKLAAQLQALKAQKLVNTIHDDELKLRRQIKMQIHTLEREKSKCEREWQLQKVSLIVDIAYAIGLMATFMVLTMPFIPISASVLASMAIAGAVLCLAFTIINNAVKGGIEVYKAHKTILEQNEDSRKKIQELIHLLQDNKNLDKDEIKFLYLEIMKNQAETEYQKLMMIYKSANLVHSILIQCLIPAVVFSCLIFLPLGIGIPTLVAAAMLAIGSQLLVDSLIKPQEKNELEFDRLEYQMFCDDILKPKPKIERFRLFSWASKKGPLCDENRSTDVLEIKIPLCN
ncbi:hypothetical protein [Fluoribacter gormanii]|uniref:hypothetical protein n=1 Tax=Fluoribacter gormanii TaxID=464 RepID=UPI00104136C2|nr:hypothetical protein [Fluoribacter gormanii]